MKFPLLVLLLLFSVPSWQTAHAQIAVDMQIKRRTFIRYEPVIATVSVTNLSGRDLVLRDGESQWFGFQISTASKDVIPPRNPDYHLDSMELKAGTTVKRSVNLNELFPLSEFGIYRVSAQIYSDELRKYFSSRLNNIEITEGQKLWEQTVGVPEGMPNAGGMHTFSLLVWQGPDRQHLYCRVEDRTSGVVFCTFQVGHILAGTRPDAAFDAANNFYVLTFAGPKTYLLHKISVNGEYLGQTQYAASKSRPTLRRLANGTLQIVGGRRDVAQTTVETPPQPKLSDRPPGFPGN